METSQSFEEPAPSVLRETQSLKTRVEAFMAKLSPDCIKGQKRCLVVDWLHSQTIALSTSTRTFEVASSLVDLFCAKHPQMRDFDLRAVAAVALSIAIKIFEDFVLTPEYLTQALELPADDTRVSALEGLLLNEVEWALDLPTATDVADCLSSALPHAWLPPREDWSEFIAACYMHSAFRFGPLAIAVAGLFAASEHRSDEVKLALDVLNFHTTEVDVILSEAEQFLHKNGENPMAHAEQGMDS